VAFKKYEPKTEKVAGPQVRIRPTGLISFDALSVEEFGLERFSYAVLYFDAENKTVGVKPVDDNSDPSSLKLSKRRSTVGLKAPDFFKHFRIKIDKAMKLDVRKDDEGILSFMMKGIRKRRGRKSK